MGRSAQPYLPRAPGRKLNLIGRRSLLAGPLLLASLYLAAPAAAMNPAVIVKVHQTSGLVSPYFQLAAAPGRNVTAGSLDVDNPSAHPVTVQLAPVDAMTTNTLGSAYAMPGSGAHGSTTWLRLSRPEVTIAPRSAQSVRVSVDVPATATPGDYLSGVSVEALGQVQSTNVSSGVSIGEIDRYAIGVEVSLPGARYPAIHFTGASVTRQPAGLAFLVAASNTGNVILKNVHGWVKVTSGHRQVVAATIAPGTFVSATGITYPLLSRTEQPRPGSRYRVRATLYYQGGVARLDQTVVFSHAAAVRQQNYGGRKLPKSGLPWLWILVALALIAVIAALRSLMRSFDINLVRTRPGRPMTRKAGLKLLESSLGRDRERPVSIALVTARRRAIPAIADAIQSCLRPGDRICDLGPEGLLLICPRTSRRELAVLERDLRETVARDPDLARVRVEIARATAVKPTTARKLLARAEATHRRQQESATHAPDLEAVPAGAR
jgi:hypothetical protein